MKHIPSGDGSIVGRWCAVVILAGTVLFSNGCNIFGMFGAMEESRRRNSTKTVQAEYVGLKAKNWAVVVIADRSIQAELPDIVPWMTGKICERLVKEQPNIVAKGMTPANKVLKYQYEHPSWVTKPHSELAKDLQVDRLIVVEIIEYRLNDPGNQYLWNGLASGTVGVVEADGTVPDEFSFQKPINVRFPDGESFGPNDFDRAVVATALGQRFLDRVTWLFYKHEEPYYPKY